MKEKGTHTKGGLEGHGIQEKEGPTLMKQTGTTAHTLCTEKH